jgi:hypothetical protein
MAHWKIGDRCQTENKDGIKVGVIADVRTEEVERTRYNHNYVYGSRGREEKYYETVTKEVTVKWDDGAEEKFSPYHIHAEDTAMERAFRVTCDEAQARINQKLKEAMDALTEAENISEETGIPFSSGISPLGQSYVPSTLDQKHPDIDREFINSVTDSYGEYEGWQHSAVC